MAVVKMLVNLLFRLLFRVKVRGTLGKHERLLIVANHTSFLDGLLLGAFLPIMPTWLVHTSVAKVWYFKIGLRFLPHLVVDATSPLAMKGIIALLEKGSPVMIFPEGRITITGGLMKMYDGPAFVAAKSGAAVVPIHIDGLIYSPAAKMTGDFPRLSFPKVTMTIGEPRTIELPQRGKAKERRRAASEQLRRILMEGAVEAYQPTTLFPALLDAIDLHGRGRVMLTDLQLKPATYKEILRGALALGRLVSKFSEEGENVGVLMPNVSATVYLLFGMFAMRRVPAMLNYTAGLEGMLSGCRMARVKTLLTSRAFLEKAKLNSAAEGLAKEVKILYLEDLRPQFGLRDKLWLMGWAMRHPRRVMKQAKPEEPAVILFTSGSEGKPKGVVLSHNALLANVAQIKAVFDFNNKEKFFSALPVFHAFGLTGGVILPLMRGCPVLIYPSPLHYRMVPEMVYDQDCTVLFSTNTFLNNYAKAAHPYDLARVRYLVVGAEKLTDDVRTLCMNKFGLRVLEGYGATECAPVIAVNTGLANQPGSVGEVLPGMEWRLAPVPGIDRGGELHVKGPNVMLGYLKEDKPGVIQPPCSPFGPGWYDTGDVVMVDRGFVTIQGRIKRFAKVAGEMVSLEAAETLAIEASPSSMHAAVAVKDLTRGEVIVLYTEDRGLSRELLVEAARTTGAPELAVPKRIVHVDKMPLLGNGKKNYVAIAKMAEGAYEVGSVR